MRASADHPGDVEVEEPLGVGVLVAEPVDVAKVDFYKELQRKMARGLAPVMELEAEDGASVGDTTITVFGTDRTELRRLGTARRAHVALFDPRSDAQFLYPATILHSGLLSASDASADGISFSPRRCAYRKGRQFAALQPSGPIDQAVLNEAEYFVTVRLGALTRRWWRTTRRHERPSWTR